MSKTSRGTVIYRAVILLKYLEEPHTVKEIAEHLGIRPDCAYVYIAVLRVAQYPLEERSRIIPGTGRDPIEYWINYKGDIVLEGLRTFARLRGM